ncbi:MAG: CPBP family intramembrane metalloprotease, partial [Sphingobacteriales bacterium]
LLMIAILPAIGEELFFRGTIQNIFTALFKNPHVAVWLTAILFSAIHLQFYGFLPRMFLGALFGYLFIWGKSIWLPILGHFLNNGFAVIMAFRLQQEGKSISELDNAFSPSWYAILCSIVFTFACINIYFKQASYPKPK